MALNITYTIECHCGADARATITYLDLYPGEPIVIDAELALGQRDFGCAECGCTIGTGDIETEVSDDLGLDCPYLPTLTSGSLQGEVGSS